MTALLTWLMMLDRFSAEMVSGSWYSTRMRMVAGCMLGGLGVLLLGSPDMLLLLPPTA